MQFKKIQLNRLESFVEKITFIVEKGLTGIASLFFIHDFIKTVLTIIKNRKLKD